MDTAASPTPTTATRLRPARVGEEDALTALIMRSVQETWGHSDEFMAWEPDAIIMHPEFITGPGAITTVLETEAGEMIGVVVLRDNPPDRATAGIEMSRLMIAPEHVGHGYGRLLWDYAVATVRALGAPVMTLDAEQNAEAFYLRMGAETIGELDLVPPMLPDWRVKVMRYVMTPESS